MYFWLEFEKKTISIFLISNLEFFNMRSFIQNLKILTFKTKNASNFSDCKVWCKIKICKFGTKIALFGYFWAGILGWNSYLKSAPSNLFNCKFCLNLWPKICDLSIFGLEFKKKIAIFKICLLTTIPSVYLKKSLKTFYIKFTQKKVQ